MFLTDIQNTSVEEHKGTSKEEWHDYFKNEYLLNFYIRENLDGFAETYSLLEQHYRNAMEDLNRGISRLLTTTKLTVKVFAEYLRCIEHWAHSHGIILRTDRYLIELATKYGY
jgi:hypothetical protein